MPATGNDSARTQLIILLVLAIFLVSCSNSMEQTSDCAPDQGPCKKNIGDTAILFEISPKPVRVMRELSFSVTIENGNVPERLIAEISMPGMFMGKNEVMLLKQPGSTFTGKGIIPRCSSGKKLWQAAIDIPGRGKVVYTFNVSY